MTPWTRRCWPTVLLLATALAGCSRKSEQDQLDALRGSLGYRSYQTFSEHGLPLAYATFARSTTLANEPALPPWPEMACGAHMGLSYLALSANKLTPALVEADLLERDCNGAVPANALRAVVFHRRQWPGLAQTASDAAWRDAPDPQQAGAALIGLHLVLGYAAISDQAWDRAAVHVDALALLLEVAWLGEIGQATLAFHEHRYVDGLRRIKRLSENPVVPAEVRSELHEAIALIERETGDLDSRLVMARILGRVLWMVVKEHGSPAMRQLITFVEMQPLDAGADVASDAARGWWARLRQWWSDDDAVPSPAPSPAS